MGHLKKGVSFFSGLILVIATVVALWNSEHAFAVYGDAKGDSDKVCGERRLEQIPRSTMESFGNILNAVGNYWEQNNHKFPARLEDLVPKYLSSIPPCVTKWHGSQVGSVGCGPIRNTGKWIYCGDGGVGIDSKHIDPKKIQKHPYVKQERNFGALGRIRSAISIYYGDTDGVYPPSLKALVPKYLSELPEVWTCAHKIQKGETSYSSKPNSAGQVQDTGKWGYVNNPQSPNWGEVFISATEDSLYLK